jgi:uncharacterized protein GlcG (DUF336 family)
MCNFTWLFVLLFAVASCANADDVLSLKRVGTDLAVEIAQESMKACRASGYQVSVVVVDRNANTQVVIRDDLASRFTIELAEKKANAAILGATSTRDFAANRSDIKNELNEIDGILIIEGGLPISAAGALVGAVGVSGAPGGGKDAACAQEALDKLSERLEFAD